MRLTVLKSFAKVLFFIFCPIKLLHSNRVKATGEKISLHPSNLLPVQMVKSKSAGYICPSLKERKAHRFSLAEGSLSDEAANSLLPAAEDECDYNRGK